MLASFLYRPEVPSPESLLDMARCALVASTGDELDEDVCKALLDGLCAAWLAARSHEDEDREEDLFGTKVEAERAYIDVYLKRYTATVRRHYPQHTPDEDGVAWWPDGLTFRGGWPKAFLLGLAVTLGEVEGDRSVAMYQYMEKHREVLPVAPPAKESAQ